MTKAAATILQARSEMSAQVLVAQGTRAGKGHTGQGAALSTWRAHGCSWTCGAWQESCCPRRWCGGNAEVRQQLGLPIAGESWGMCPQDGGEVKSPQLPLQHKAWLDSPEELLMRVPYHIFTATDHSHWHFLKLVHDWYLISSTP